VIPAEIIAKRATAYDWMFFISAKIKIMVGFYSRNELPAENSLCRLIAPK
jgi:hypothetical protein